RGLLPQAASNQLRYTVDAASGPPRRQFLEYTLCGPRVRKTGRSDLDETCPRQEVLKRVLAGPDPARSEDRDVDARARPCDRMYADRQQGRPAHAARPRAEHRP